MRHHNDGFQDLYVGAWGNPADDLGFRSPQQGNLDALLLNMKDGTFVDITKAAFGDNVNARSATSIGCADVNLDGWLDLFVGNLMDQDFRHFEDLTIPVTITSSYMNNGDLTFEDVTESAGVQGPQILMRYPDNTPVSYMNPETGEAYEGYNPLTLDAQGNRAGEPNRPDSRRAPSSITTTTSTPIYGLPTTPTGCTSTEMIQTLRGSDSPLWLAPWA